MSYKEVTAYLGGKGVEVEQLTLPTNVKAAPNIIRVWANNDSVGSGLQITFDCNGIVQDSYYSEKTD